MPKSRAEAVHLINRQLDELGHTCEHKGDYTKYGKQELKQLMDFIYESKPITDSELIVPLPERKYHA